MALSDDDKKRIDDLVEYHLNTSSLDTDANREKVTAALRQILTTAAELVPDNFKNDDQIKNPAFIINAVSLAGKSNTFDSSTNQFKPEAVDGELSEALTIVLRERPKPAPAAKTTDPNPPAGNPLPATPPAPPPPVVALTSAALTRIEAELKVLDEKLAASIAAEAAAKKTLADEQKRYDDAEAALRKTEAEIEPIQNRLSTIRSQEQAGTAPNIEELAELRNKLAPLETARDKQERERKELKDGPLASAIEALEEKTEARESDYALFKEKAIERARELIKLHSDKINSADPNKFKIIAALNHLLELDTDKFERSPSIDFAGADVLASARTLAVNPEAFDASGNAIEPWFLDGPFEKAVVALRPTPATNTGNGSPQNQNDPASGTGNGSPQTSSGTDNQNWTGEGLRKLGRDTANAFDQDFVPSAKGLVRNIGEGVASAYTFDGNLPEPLSNLFGTVGGAAKGAWRLGTGMLSKAYNDESGRWWLAGGTGLLGALWLGSMVKNIPILKHIPGGGLLATIVLIPLIMKAAKSAMDSASGPAAPSADRATSAPAMPATITLDDGTKLDLRDLDKDNVFAVQTTRPGGQTFVDFDVLSPSEATTAGMNASNVIYVPASKWPGGTRPRFEDPQFDAIGHTAPAANDAMYNQPMIGKMTGTDGQATYLYLDNDSDRTNNPGLTPPPGPSAP